MINIKSAKSVLLQQGTLNILRVHDPLAYHTVTYLYSVLRQASFSRGIEDVDMERYQSMRVRARSEALEKNTPEIR